MVSFKNIFKETKDSHLRLIGLTLDMASKNTGMHIILFVMASSVLLKKGGRTQIASFSAMVIMLGLATADVGFSYHVYLYRMDEILAGDTRNFLTIVYPKFLIHLINK